jgi:hypothetical protein
MASNDPRVHVGLGEATRIDSVQVKWPDGKTDSFGPYDADRVLTIRRAAR